MPSPSPKDLSRILADINKQIATAEQLTIQPSDYETLERALKVLKELREQRRGLLARLENNGYHGVQLHTKSHMSERSCLVAFVVAGLTLVTSPGTADAIVLDDFNVGPVQFSSANNADQHVLQTNLDPSHVVGGSRFVHFFFVGPPPGNSMEIDTAAGELRVNVGLQCCTELTVSYGSSSAPLHLDLTADQSDRFLFRFGAIDTTLAYQIPSLNVIDTQGHMVQPLRNVTLPPNPHAGFSLAVPFAQLLGINYADIQSLTLDIGRYPGGASFVLDDFRTVPEPASVCATLVLLTAVIMSRRNRPYRAPADDRARG